MTVALKRADGTVICSTFEPLSVEYWIEDGPERSTKTVNNVSFFFGQGQQGRTQLIAYVTCIFSNLSGLGGTITQMNSLRAWAREWLRFTDHTGVVHVVRIRNRIDPERVGGQTYRKYLVDLELLRQGFE